MIRRISILLLLGLALLSSCVYPYTPDLESTAEKTLVVDGQILIGGTSSIKLEYLTSLNQTTTTSPAGWAWIENDRGDRYYPASSGHSSSLLIPTEDAPLGQQYRAVIEADGMTYVSDWLTPNPAPVIKDIRFGADDTDVNITVDLETGPDPSGYLGFSYEETWRFHSDFMPQYTVIPSTWSVVVMQEDYPYYWCYRSALSKQLVLLDYTAMESGSIRNFTVRNFRRTDSRNHSRYSILLNVFSLSRSAYEYNRKTQEMSEVGGDLFTPDPGMLKGNLTCENDPSQPVMGLVLAGEVTSKRAWMNSIYLISRAPDESILFDVPQEQLSYFYYELNYRPVQDVTREGITFVGWGPHRCINCIEAGGTQVKPDFWE